MPKKKVKINLYYFSGSGNTLLIAQTMKAKFEENRYEVTLIPIEKAKAIIAKDADIYGFAFPIAIHTTFPFVRKFIERFPFDENHKIFAVATLGGTKSGLFTYMLDLQKKRHFQILGMKNIQMPNNFMQKEIDLEANEVQIIKADLEAQEFINDLIHGKKRKYQKDLISILFEPIGGSKWFWRFIQRMYKFQINHVDCSKCLICINICPKNNFILQEGKICQKNKCELCLRCITICPKQAISIPKKEYEVYRRNKKLIQTATYRVDHVLVDK